MKYLTVKDYYKHLLFIINIVYRGYILFFINESIANENSNDKSKP